MSQRIRQLEDALSSAHNSDPHGGRHPLLRDELLALKFGSGSRGVSEETDDQFTLSSGTLAVTESGGSSYFGVSAGALVSTPVVSSPLARSGDPIYRPNHLRSRPYQRVGPRCPRTTSGITTRASNQNYPRMSRPTFDTPSPHILKRSIYVSSTPRGADSIPSKSPTSWTTPCRSFTRAI